MKAIFWELPENLSMDAWAISVVLQHYGPRTHIAVLTPDIRNAEQLDELLWQLPDRFIAHALADETTASKAPVVIGPSVQPASRPFEHAINLSERLAINEIQCHTWHEPVPADEADRQEARKRFKSYRQQGVQTEFKPWTGADNDIQG
ncbi:MAG: DNA polymerase III subunit chi [Gammaproteobacteria bacterium]|nr:MAG: DNA polymerase III subunit chi [Gammaproteobacteria bacterium]